jgi:hypothetical protein
MSKLKEGDEVRTNAVYKKKISPHAREGVLRKPCSWIEGAWHVKIPEFRQSQVIHSKFLEKKS